MNVLYYQNTKTESLKVIGQVLNPFTCMVSLTFKCPKTERALIAKARTLDLYACLCINCCNMKTKRLTENYNYIFTHH